MRGSRRAGAAGRVLGFAVCVLRLAFQLLDAALHLRLRIADPLSGLATLRAGTVSVEMDFGLGFELDSVEGQRVTAYRLERQIAAGSLPPTGLFGPPPRPDTIASPASLPWREPLLGF